MLGGARSPGECPATISASAVAKFSFNSTKARRLASFSCADACIIRSSLAAISPRRISTAALEAATAAGITRGPTRGRASKTSTHATKASRSRRAASSSAAFF